jgi:hypothetical protein
MTRDRSLEHLSLFRSPALGEERFERAVQMEYHTVAPARNRLNPVTVLRDARLTVVLIPYIRSKLWNKDEVIYTACEK